MITTTNGDGKRTLRCRTVAEGGLRQSSYIRNVPVQRAAEPDSVERATKRDHGGIDDAPNALEALLAAFGSCLAAALHANALARHIPVRHIEVNLEADMFLTAHWGSSDIAPNPIGFDTIRALVSIEADMPRAELDALLKHTMLWSPVANTLYNPINLDVTLADDTAPEIKRS